MKCLRIEENQGWYKLCEEEWKSIEKINKDDLMKLLNLAIDSEDFEMDEYDKEKIGNPAHDIIYSNLYAKFKELINNKTRFKDESESMYKDAIDKYSKRIQ